MRFLQKFRRGLLTENRVSRYLLYAVGEIVLVMIGILLALQVNTWNEARRSKILEIELYREIQEDLSASTEDLENGYEQVLQSLEASERLLEHLKHKKPLNDSVVYYLEWTAQDDQFFPKTAGFEALKSVGLRSLTNDTLREQITSLYELAFERVVQLGREKATVRNVQFMSPFVDKYRALKDDSYYRTFSRGDSVLRYRRKIVNYDQMLEDQQLLLNLDHANTLRGHKLNSYKWTRQIVGDVQAAIEQELDHLTGH